MTLIEIIKATYPPGLGPNPEQQKAIEHTTGPLLIVAGPGSGKTKTLITRTLNLVLCHNVKPENVLLCTFTEKAARELRDRLNAGLRKCGADHIDIHEMTIGTIHSVCQRIIDEYPNETGVGVYSKSKGLGRGYTVLDDLKRSLFIMDNAEEILGEPIGSDKRFLGIWKMFWDAVEGCQEYFDKITEEYVDIDKLIASVDSSQSAVGKAMRAYRRLQIKQGKIDFAHLEWLAYDLLLNNKCAQKEFQNKFEYVMVDEYQDTNYIQEQLIFALANKDRNIAVVGDVDQSIYRFRGATTQNILKFPERIDKPNLKPINLGINYRSRQAIIDLYQTYRDGIDWVGCRYPLEVVADTGKEQNAPEHASCVSIDEGDAESEGTKVADLIHTLKRDGVITDYNQVAILLYSVRNSHSGQYINAIKILREQGEKIDVYAPRARLFFERPEILCVLAGLYSMNSVGLSEKQGGYPGQESESIKAYLTRCIREFKSRKEDDGHTEFVASLKVASAELTKLKEIGGKPKKTFLEYYYHVLNTPFMSQWMDEELPARHLAQLSNLIETFSEYYDCNWIGGTNADKVWDKFFNQFLRRLVDGGINEYEDKEQSFPSGAVQIMTFHQSKGLEFPVVIVGDLHAMIGAGKKVDDTLHEYYNRELLDPRDHISRFDCRRIFYVALSRAKDFLVLSGHNDLGPRILPRKDQFKPLLKLCSSWDAAKSSGTYKRPPIDIGDAETLKPVFGFTSHISAYERCPMQFKLQKLYGFVPTRTEQLWMGNVVHNTLKDIHDHVMKKKPGILTEDLVREYLEKNIVSLERQGVVAQEPKAGKHPKLVAEESILRYVKENQNKLKHCRWAEKEILVDEKDFTLTGVIDLLIHDDTGKVELIDFKAGRKANNEKYREGYADQIRLYCKQVEPKIGKFPDEGYLYWITEPDGSDPKDMIDTDPKLLEQTRKRVNATAQRIISKDFPKLKKRDEDRCGICEFERGCWKHGTT